MSIFQAGTWHMVQFHPLNHPSWLALAEEWQPMLSPYMMLAIMRGIPFLVHAVNDNELACDRGFGITVDDTVVAASQPMNSVSLPSQFGPLRAAKDKEGDLFLLETFNGQQNAMLKHFTAADAADLKALL